MAHTFVRSVGFRRPPVKDVLPLLMPFVAVVIVGITALMVRKPWAERTASDLNLNVDLDLGLAAASVSRPMPGLADDLIKEDLEMGLKKIGEAIYEATRASAAAASIAAAERIAASASSAGAEGAERSVGGEASQPQRQATPTRHG
jgi:hypothetical protein